MITHTATNQVSRGKEIPQNGYLCLSFSGVSVNCSTAISMLSCMDGGMIVAASVGFLASLLSSRDVTLKIFLMGPSFSPLRIKEKALTIGDVKEVKIFKLYACVSDFISKLNPRSIHVFVHLRNSPESFSHFIVIDLALLVLSDFIFFLVDFKPGPLIAVYRALDNPYFKRRATS
jgi:hypothetical protein